MRLTVRADGLFARDRDAVWHMKGDVVELGIAFFTYKRGPLFSIWSQVLNRCAWSRHAPLCEQCDTQWGCNSFLGPTPCYLFVCLPRRSFSFRASLARADLQLESKQETIWRVFFAVVNSKMLASTWLKCILIGEFVLGAAILMIIGWHRRTRKYIYLLSRAYLRLGVKWMAEVGHIFHWRSVLLPTCPYAFRVSERSLDTLPPPPMKNGWRRQLSSYHRNCLMKGRKRSTCSQTAADVWFTAIVNSDTITRVLQTAAMLARLLVLGRIWEPIAVSD
jgi:hypothetical protein